MATFWERAAYSDYHVLFVVLVISHFGFEGGALYLIVSVPGHCVSSTFFIKFSLSCDLPAPRLVNPFQQLVRGNITIIKVLSVRVITGSEVITGSGQILH